MAKRPAKKDSPHLLSPTNSGSSTDGTHETAERHPRETLIQEQDERERDELPTVIPFPSEKAHAEDGQPDHQEAGGDHEGGGKPGAKQSSWTARTFRDWSRFTRVRQEHTFEERIERKKRKYKQKLRHAQLARPRSAAATVIPFPSEQARAAGSPAAPSSDA